MKEEDIKNVYEIIQHSGLFTTYDHLSEDTIRKQFQWSQQHNNTMPNHEHYVIDVDGVCVGYIAVHWLETFLYVKPEGYISELFIHDKFRGQGLGTALLKFIVDKAIEKECYRIWLINVNGSESHLRKYYHKQGWTHDENDMRYILYLNHNKT